MGSAGRHLLVGLPYVVAVRWWLRLEASEGFCAGTLSLSSFNMWLPWASSEHGGFRVVRLLRRQLISTQSESSETARWGCKAFPNLSFKVRQSQFCFILLVVSHGHSPGSIGGDYPRSWLEGGVVHWRAIVADCCHHHQAIDPFAYSDHLNGWNYYTNSDGCLSSEGFDLVRDMREGSW